MSPSTPTRSATNYYVQLVWYLIQYGLASLLTYWRNKSHLVYHPEKLFPTNIYAPSNPTIHSFPPTEEMAQYLHPRYPVPPRYRLWSPPECFTNQPSIDRHKPGVVLQGELSGPPIQAGMLVMQQDRLLYIKKEIGRCARHEYYLKAEAVDISTDTSLQLFIPLPYVAKLNIFDPTPPSPFSYVTPLHRISDGFLRSPYKLVATPLI